MQKYGLIGYPLGHSFSRNYFNQKFESENIDAQYLNFEIPSIKDFKEVLKNKIHEKLDIVFLDPPYKTDFAIDAIKIVIEKDLLNQNAMIIIETDDNNRILESLKHIDCEINDIRKYGRAYLIFLKRI